MIDLTPRLLRALPPETLTQIAVDLAYRCGPRTRATVIRRHLDAAAKGEPAALEALARLLPEVTP